MAAKISCVPWTLSGWIKKTEIDDWMFAGVPSCIIEKLKALGGKTRELWPQKGSLLEPWWMKLQKLGYQFFEIDPPELVVWVS